MFNHCLVFDIRHLEFLMPASELNHIIFEEIITLAFGPEKLRAVELPRDSRLVY